MFDTALTAQQGLWFLIFAAPLCLYVAWNDLRAMKIPTWSTDALALVFVVVGLFVMPFSDYLWRYAHFGVVLVVAMLANALGVMGAGDSKFLASMAPFVALDDVGLVFFLLGAGLFVGYFVHRAARAIRPLRNLVPEWESWHQKKRFPMGFPMGGVMIFYLATPFF